MTKKLISPICVYTIVHTDKLDEAYRKGGSSSFKENKKWVTAKRLLLQARYDNMVMPIIFASAEDTRKLIYHAVLKDIQIDEAAAGGAATTFWVANLQPLHKPLPKEKFLIVKSTERYLPESDRRPYRICVTPKFVSG